MYSKYRGTWPLLIDLYQHKQWYHMWSRIWICCSSVRRNNLLNSMCRKWLLGLFGSSRWLYQAIYWLEGNLVGMNCCEYSLDNICYNYILEWTLCVLEGELGSWMQWSLHHSDILRYKVFRFQTRQLAICQCIWVQYTAVHDQDHRILTFNVRNFHTKWY